MIRIDKSTGQKRVKQLKEMNTFYHIRAKYTKISKFSLNKICIRHMHVPPKWVFSRKRVTVKILNIGTYVYLSKQCIF